jgi:biopolymer transport protein ExbB
LTHRVTWIEQLRSGGVLVVPILLVGLVALILTIERLVFLGKVRQNTDELMTQVTELVGTGNIEGAMEVTYPHRTRPTGRVLMAGLQHRSDPSEVIESALSEAMLRETPRLERFLGALKVCAAVAPLLGLLGTVTGMINTFQVITTHGTGDPRLMAGGISEAMVTTQVGLAVAIPVMIVAAFLGRRARNLSQDMEEKGLALMGALLRLRTNGEKQMVQG